MNQPEPDNERRARLVERIQAETGIDETMIEKVVHAFYARVHGDSLIGPVFTSRIADWDFHLQRMCSFWSSVILMTGRYHGAPMQKHMPLPVESLHFDRWLHLFRQTVAEICPPRAANLFMERAELIARSLESGVASAHGALLGKGERFVKTPAAASTGATVAPTR